MPPRANRNINQQQQQPAAAVAAAVAAPVAAPVVEAPAAAPAVAETEAAIEPTPKKSKPADSPIININNNAKNNADVQLPAAAPAASAAAPAAPAESAAQEQAQAQAQAEDQGADAEAMEEHTTVESSESTHESASAHPAADLRFPSVVIRIDNLVKPYDRDALSRLLRGFGRLYREYHHPLQIFALAHFATVPEAETALLGLHGVHFPPLAATAGAVAGQQQRAPLAVRFAPVSDLEQALAGDKVQGIKAQLQMKMATEGAPAAKRIIVTGKFSAERAEREVELAAAQARARAEGDATMAKARDSEDIARARFVQTESKPAVYWGVAPGYTGEDGNNDGNNNSRG